MKIKYIVLGSALFSLSLLSYSATSASGSTLNPQQIIKLANTDRAMQGSKELKESEKLDLAAALKINDMVANDYFDHVSPQGVSPWYFLKKSGYIYQSAGENLALNFKDSEKVEEAWMQSPSHRQNIINPQFTEIGVAEKEVVYKGQRTNFIVEFFGNPQ
jgi:uncharacterized protein YkwD